MHRFFRRKYVEKYTFGVVAYIRKNYREVIEERNAPRFSLPPSAKTIQKNGEPSNSEIKYSDRATSKSTVDLAMESYGATGDAEKLGRALEKAAEKTFVDALQEYLRKKELFASRVYRSARIDRRLFSKMMSDRTYRPARDTVIALALALNLTLDEAKDLLSRAGYAFSPSEIRDITIEYFFRMQIYRLDDLNGVLYNLKQKPIGK